MELLLDGNGILGFVNGSISCPNQYVDSDSADEIIENSSVLIDAYKVWKIHDKALMTLITTTLYKLWKIHVLLVVKVPKKCGLISKKGSLI